MAKFIFLMANHTIHSSGVGLCPFPKVAFWIQQVT